MRPKHNSPFLLFRFHRAGPPGSKAVRIESEELPFLSFIAGGVP